MTAANQFKELCKGIKLDYHKLDIADIVLRVESFFMNNVELVEKEKSMCEFYRDLGAIFLGAKND